MRCIISLLSFAYILMLFVISSAYAVDQAVDAQPYCHPDIKDKKSHMDPKLDGVKKIILVIDFFDFEHDEERYSKPFHTKVFGEALKGKIESWFKPVPKGEFDPNREQILKCYWRDSRPVEIVYMGNQREPMDSDRNKYSDHYQSLAANPENLIFIVKRYSHFWSLFKERSSKKFGNLKNPQDLFAISAQLYRPNSKLDPLKSLLWPYSISFSDQVSPNDELLADFITTQLAGSFFD